MSYPEERDPELGDVLEEVSRRLKALESIRGRERDDALVLVEAYAAPYALAFFHEIERLDALVAKLASTIDAGNDDGNKKR